ncbi:ModD protein [Paramagnetospirillum marisnigri]|uniref:Putative pyrophosphorylase ModD n=1 Tax=Paramagnetospirillum marisnigri TaxID=1285242 RepID=A0A178M3Y3_9PROT|nr:ModD protein [Paramagnetospirillum marisnigri]OAN42942.1 ModD protein [Paramagnetospirillum marisnigri]
MILPRLPDAELDRLLAEDAPHGDLTTLSLGIGERAGAMVFRARADMVLACSEEAARLLELAGATVTSVRPSGSILAAGETLLEAHGPAGALLMGWKVAQTLVEATSGIAGATRRMVEAARAVSPHIAVACTRKTFPGTKSLAIKAIMAGGAMPHRLGLSETVLLFPEHRALAPDQGFAALIGRLKAACPEKRIVVEVKDAAEADSACAAGADVVQLEKFTPAQVAMVVERIGEACVVAAAGGVNAANAADYARAGARVLVTSSPYWAPPADVAVTISGA